MVGGLLKIIRDVWTWVIDSGEPALIVSLVALVVAVIALVYAIRTYWLKAGERVRFTYSLSSSVYSEDKYIGSITLENLKDKALVIFEIYLKIGNSYFLELKKFEESPLIIKPFEVYQKHFDPIIFYSVNTKRVKLDHLLDDRKVKKQVVLSTTYGKHKARANITHWSPLKEYFENAFSAIIQPRWLIHKGTAYGSNVRFLLDITKKDGSDEVVPIYPDDYRWNRLRNLTLTKEVLESKISLNAFICEKLEDGTINWKSFEIIEFRKEVEDIEGFGDEEPIRLEAHGKIKHHVVGRALSIIHDIKLKAENKARTKSRLRSKSEDEKSDR